MSTVMSEVIGEGQVRFPIGPLHRFSVEQYLEMVRAGIITDEDKVELLEGVIVAKMGRNPPHVTVAKLVFAALSRVLPDGWHAAKEDPFQSTDSVPEPDCAILRGAIRDYGNKTPASSDIGLVVEVSNTSLSRDRGRKRRAYARAGLPFYWLVNLRASRLELYSDPTGPADKPTYHNVRILGPDDEVPVVLDGREVGRIAVRDILP